MYNFSKRLDATPFQSLLFNEKLADITSTYKRYFSTMSRRSSIAEYIRCYHVEGKMHLHIKEDLPDQIARECRIAFYSIFG